MLKFWLSLVRWQNLVIVALTLLMFRYLVYRPILESSAVFDKTGYLINGLDYILFIIGMLSLTAAGNIINDVFDVAVDKINKSEVRIVEKHIPIGNAIVAYWSILVFGLAINLYLCNTYDALNWAWIYPITAALLHLYSSFVQRTILLGNILVSLLSAAVIAMAFLVEAKSFLYILELDSSSFVWQLATELTLFYIIFAFLISMARELIKDREDLLGDKMNKYKTFTIIAGVKATRHLATFFLLMMLCCMYYYLNYQLVVEAYIIFGAAFILITVPTIALIYMIQSAENKLAFHQVATFLKWLMLAGLILLPVITMNL